MNSRWLILPLIFLCIATITGTLMRTVVFFDIVIPYGNILHAHSHIAFQGWLYLALFLLFTNKVLKPKLASSRRYRWQLYGTAFTLFGILFSFLYQGYGPISIVFSSLFQFMNYIFAITFIIDCRKKENLRIESDLSLKFIRASILLMCLSTLGPWAVALIKATHLGNTEYFDAALYFFFHFQYNGWFTFAIIGILFQYAELNGYHFKSKIALRSFYFLFATVIPGYILSLLGMSFANILIFPSLIIGLVQLYGLSLFVFCWKNSGLFKNIRSNYFLLIALLCLLLKFILQGASAIPSLNEIAFFNRPVIIAYIHLTMIGFLSFSILGLLIEFKWIAKNIIGQVLFIVGFISSEIIILTTGFHPHHLHFKLIVLFSAFMMLGALLILAAQLMLKHNQKLL